MNKKENRMAVRQAAQQAVIRDEQNHRIEHAATNPIKEVLKSLHTTLDLCQYFEHKKLKGYADFFNSSSSFCCGVI